MKSSHDTWEKTEAALSVIKRLIIDMHNSKPDKNTKEELLWEMQLSEIRRWAVTVHYRRIELCIASKNENSSN